MTITRIETDIIPNTLEGKAFAKDYIQRLKRQGVFIHSREDTQHISILAEYHLELKAETEES